ncbi:MAG: OsmC family protein [Fibrobacteria bacterium]|jgi:putative redox protein|nr:OsmC family protein [Fibrobacteria bacterium]
MRHEIEAQWIGGMEFHAAVSGHTVVMDAPERAGGDDRGPIPKPLMLAALAGCTGMDVAALLRKAGKPADTFSLKVTGEISARPPIVYEAVHVEYDFTGSEADREAALEAVTRSQEQYCGVSHMLKRILPVTWSVVYNGRTIFTNATVSAAAPADPVSRAA